MTDQFEISLKNRIDNIFKKYGFCLLDIINANGLSEYTYDYRHNKNIRNHSYYATVSYSRNFVPSISTIKTVSKTNVEIETHHPSIEKLEHYLRVLRDEQNQRQLEECGT